MKTLKNSNPSLSSNPTASPATKAVRGARLSADMSLRQLEKAGARQQALSIATAKVEKAKENAAKAQAKKAEITKKMKRRNFDPMEPENVIRWVKRLIVLNNKKKGTVEIRPCKPNRTSSAIESFEVLINGEYVWRYAFYPSIYAAGLVGEIVIYGDIDNCNDLESPTASKTIFGLPVRNVSTEQSLVGPYLRVKLRA